MYQRDLKSSFPTDLSHLCASFASAAGQMLTPEAGIVNYYPSGTNMGGHLDDAELTMAHPIVSVSLGLSALFLIGGRSRQDKPTPILLRSGVVLVMSGESRYCYHGVPVILPADFSPVPRDVPSPALHPGAADGEGAAAPTHSGSLPVCDLQGLVDIAAQDGCPERMRAVVRYLQQARINMNVRQVRPSDMGEHEWVGKCGTGAATATS
jgi:alkylated DNA repair protein alkB family protein 1